MNDAVMPLNNFNIPFRIAAREWCYNEAINLEGSVSMTRGKRWLAGLLAANGIPGLIALPVGAVLMLAFLAFMKKRQAA